MNQKISLRELENLFKQARTIDALNEALTLYLARFGITTFSFTYYAYYTNALNKLKYDYATKNFLAWHKHYIGEHYEEVDSTLDKAHRNTLPTFWDLQQQLKEARTPKERQMRLDSIEFGSEKGLSIPIHGPLEDFANFLVVQMRGETCLNQWQEIQYELFAAGYFYYSYLQPLLLKVQEPIEKFQLNKREIQCLQLIAKQTPIKVMAQKLHITERTINFHIQNLNKKLGTKNKHQSVAKAIQKGLIKI